MSKALTARFVESAKPDQTRRLEIPDAGSGLYLIVQPSGVKSWAFRYRGNGAPKKLTLGPYPLLGLADAREKARDALSDLDHGRDPIAQKKAHRAATDIAHVYLYPRVAAQFLTSPTARQGKPFKRLQQQARFLGLHTNDAGELVPFPGGLGERWADKRVQDITAADVLDWIKRVNNRSGATANRTLDSVKGFFRWCTKLSIQNEHVLDKSPCHNISDPAPRNARDRILADNELALIWRASGTMGYPFGSAVRLMLLTGQRRDECAQIVRAELQMAERRWVLPAARVKNDLEHEVPLSDAAIELLQSVPNVEGRAGYVFTASGIAGITGWSVGKRNLDGQIEKIAGKPIAPWVLHDLRRTMSTWMHDNGIEPHIVDAVTNHVAGRRAGTGKNYNHAAYRTPKRLALDRWAQHVEKITGAKGAEIMTLRATA